MRGIIMKKQTPKAGVFLLLSVGWLLGAQWTVPAFAQEIIQSSEIERGLVAITGDEDARAVDLDIRFSVNSDKLTDAAQRQLNELGHALNSENLADALFEINGHTDASGKAAHNKTLSLKRAKAVRYFLVKSHAIKLTRLVVHGYGEDHLKNPLDPKAAENRRVEIVAKHERSELPATKKKKKKGWGVVQ
jgi:outer membrane protein OmpA-like peptidoglycan-associated protein